jgi:hypothetical protein
MQVGVYAAGEVRMLGCCVHDQGTQLSTVAEADPGANGAALEQLLDRLSEGQGHSHPARPLLSALAAHATSAAEAAAAAGCLSEQQMVVDEIRRCEFGKGKQEFKRRATDCIATEQLYFQHVSFAGK